MRKPQERCFENCLPFPGSCISDFRVGGCLLLVQRLRALLQDRSELCNTLRWTGNSLLSVLWILVVVHQGGWVESQDNGWGLGWGHNTRERRGSPLSSSNA